MQSDIFLIFPLSLFFSLWAVISLEASHDDDTDDDEAAKSFGKTSQHDDVGNPIICRQVHAISTDLSAFKLVFVFRMQATILKGFSTFF